MKAYVFSIGEATTGLCEWSVRRLGYDVKLYCDKTGLHDKLKRLYNEVEIKDDERVLRIDADIIANRNIKKIKLRGRWWVQAMAYNWYKQDISVTSVSLISGRAIRIARKHIDRFKDDLRPETRIWRLPEFHNPRRCGYTKIIAGIHGWGQSKEDIIRVKKMKAARKQYDFDWELTDKMEIVKNLIATQKLTI